MRDGAPALGLRRPRLALLLSECWSTVERQRAAPPPLHAPPLGHSPTPLDGPMDGLMDWLSNGCTGGLMKLDAWMDGWMDKKRRMTEVMND